MLFYFYEIYCVELIASQEIRLERNKTENRLLHKPSKRDIEASNKRLLNEDIYIALLVTKGKYLLKIILD